MYIISCLGCPFRFVSTFLHTGGFVYMYIQEVVGGWGYEFKGWMHEIEIEWGVKGIEWSV